MKKLFIALMCIAGLAIATACGGGDSSEKKSVEEVTEEIIETSMFGDPTMKACKAAWDKGLGLSFDKIEPDYKYIAEDSIKAFRGVLCRGRYQGYATFVKEDRTDVSREEFEAYVRKLYAATQSIADGGKVIYGWESKSTAEGAETEWPVEEILGRKFLGMPMTNLDWGFKKDGNFKRISVELVDANKKYPARLSIQFYDALQKSIDDTMKDAEKALEDPEVQKTIKDAFEK